MSESGPQEKGLASTVVLWYMLGSPLVQTERLVDAIRERPWMVVGRKKSWIGVREDPNLFG